MQKSKLIRLLRTLTVEEMRELGYFIDSPYFNTSQQVKKLFKYLRRSHPVYKSVRIQKEKAFEKLFPEIPEFDDARMRQIMFKLTRLVEDFLVAEEVRKEKAHRQKHLIKALGKRNLYKDFTREINGRLKELETQPHKDMEDFQEVLFLNHELFFHPQTQKFKTDIRSLVNLTDALDRFFVMGKLQYSHEMIGRENILAEDYKIWLLNEVLNSQLIEKNVAFRAFSHLLILQKSQVDNDLFFQIKLLFEQEINNFSFEQKKLILRTLSNYTIRQINGGNTDFLANQFALYKIGVENNMYIDNGKIHDSEFTNIVNTGIGLGEFEWTYRFINIYQHHLEESVKRSAINIAWAYWNFYQKRFNNVLDYLNNVKYLPSYSIRVKSLRMRLYFELYMEKESYYEVLLADLNSFEQFIRRNQRLSERLKISYLNLILFTKKIARILSVKDYSSKDIKRLKKEIDKSKPVAVKNWLTEKVENLILQK